MFQESKYRVATEKIINKKLNYVKSVSDREQLEKLLGVQLEEAIIDAQREVVLSRTLKQYAVWQPLMEDAPSSQYEWPPVSKFHPKWTQISYGISKTDDWLRWKYIPSSSN